MNFRLLNLCYARNRYIVQILIPTVFTISVAIY